MAGKKQTASRKIPNYRLVNATQLAPILGVSISRISHLVHYGLPRLDDSKLYDLAAVVPWVVSRALEKGDVSGSGSARQQYFEAMTERAQLDTAKLKGDLYGREETDQFFMGLLVQFREAIIALPERVTRDRAIAAELEREISDALADLAAAISTWVETGGEGATATQPAAEPKRGRVGKRQPANASGKPDPRKVQSRKRALPG